MILIVGIVLIIVCVATAIKVYKIKNKAQEVRLDQVYNESKTGDIIYFRWHTVDAQHDLVSKFTHVGLIVEKDNEKFILETHKKGDTVHMGVESGGVHMYPMKKRIEMYEGLNFFAKNKRSPTLPNKLEEYMKIPFYDDYTGHFTRTCLIKSLCEKCIDDDRKKKGMFCSEFVGYLLKEMGMLEQTRDLYCLSPESFETLKDANGEFIYGETIRILKN